jgi:hypothetical protein
MTIVLPASAEWLAVREAADGRSRSRALAVAAAQRACSPFVVHDLAGGTGSMMRWFSPFLPPGQTWVQHEWDPPLLSRAAGAAHEPERDLARQRDHVDIDALSDDAFAGASIVTASGLLDLITAEEAEAIVRACVAAGAPALFTLTVTGHIRLDPVDPGDRVFESTFNDHQRRRSGGRQLLGPDAVSTVVGLFRAAGWSVRIAESPWLLDMTDRRLIGQWLQGRITGAVEERPALREWADEYLYARSRQLVDGSLTVRVDHQDIFAWSP